MHVGNFYMAAIEAPRRALALEPRLDWQAHPSTRAIMLDSSEKGNAWDMGYVAPFSFGYLSILLTPSQHVLDDVELGIYAVKKIPIGPEVPTLFMLMELATGGSIEDWLSTSNSCSNEMEGTETVSPRLDFETVSRVIIELATGLAYIHSRGIVHRDLKPSNLLLLDGGGSSWQHPGRLVISDFGECCSSIIHGEATTVDEFKEVSPAYAAPEVIASCETGVDEPSQSKAYMEAGDIWSVGVIMFELMTGQSFDMNRWAKRHKSPKVLSATYLDIISGCLSLNPMDRPSASELLAQLIAAKENGIFLEKTSPPPPIIRGLLEYNKKPLCSTRGRLYFRVIGALVLGLLAIILTRLGGYFA